MPRIPVSPKDLPTEGDRFGDLDESLTYTAIIEMIGDARKDKNDHDFISIRTRITSPEKFLNRVVYDNYISLPWAPKADDDTKQRQAAMQSGDRLGDLARAADIEADPDGSWDTDLLVNKEITFTIKNEPYQGQMRPRIATYLLPKGEVRF